MTQFSASDATCMARALALAERGLNTTHPNPRVGCVITREGRTVGEGWHARAGGPHAEVEALAQAGEQARGATVYVTLEPCAHKGRTPPCADQLIEAGVARVVAACGDPFEQVSGRGFERLRNAGIEVEVGLLEASARSLNAGFFSRVERGRPFVRLKLAASLDGMTAMASGESQWITGPDARADTHRWRARASAVMTGIGTQRADDPRLNARDQNTGPSCAVVLDSRWRMAADAALIASNDQVLWLGREDLPVPAWASSAGQVRAIGVPADGSSLDLAKVMAVLAGQQINELHVEAGAILSGALLSAGLVDELLLYVAPRLLGAGQRGLAQLPGLDSLADSINLEWVEVRRTGQDLRLRLSPAGSRTD